MYPKSAQSAKKPYHKRHGDGVGFDQIRAFVQTVSSVWFYFSSSSGDEIDWDILLCRIGYSAENHAVWFGRDTLLKEVTRAHEERSITSVVARDPPQNNSDYIRPR